MPEYLRNPPLDDDDLDRDPLRQFALWLADAQAAELVEPTAMSLATCDAAGNPSQRMVLFKGLVDGGFSFYSNYESRKGTDLASNPRAALLFWWDKLERQVRVEGAVERLGPELSAEYFHARPRLSQLASYTSRQSRMVESRAVLQQRMAENTQRFEDQEVPCPAHWGGYRVIPERLEFWQGQRGRFHDRLIYEADGGAWRIQRLEP